MTVEQPATVGLAPRTLLTAAAVAVGFAAADTYVVVMALPDMMGSVSLNPNELQRAAPIVSGFLLGYIAMLPLMGRIADVRGRVPVLVGSLVVFSLGSLVTAASYDLSSMVTGRFLQGVGGGGLVPATLALVADIWPADRRGLPLGVVGAVQELGSVIGPLYGALVLTQASWRAIFWLNLVAGLALATTIAALAWRDRAIGDTRGSPGALPDLLGLVLGAAACAALALVLVEPSSLTSGVTTGRAFIAYIGDSRWTTPIALWGLVLAALFVVRELTAAHPLVRLRGLVDLSRQADLAGATLLGLALGGVVLAFATADPENEVFSPLGPWLLVGSVVCAALFWWRQRTAREPLIPAGAFGRPGAWGALVVSLFIGAALVAALVDIPVFARLTIYGDSQLGAALVLVRLLAALPIGALLGGYLLRRVEAGVLGAGGMVAAALGFAWMTQWDRAALDHPIVTVPLVLCGLGFGIAIAPVNASLLASTRAETHGVASALLVVARMVGMLVGISVLTEIGLRRFYALSTGLPPVDQLCPSGGLCDAYDDLLKDAAIVQVHTIFWGAAVCSVVAAVLCLLLIRSARSATVPAERGADGLGV
ncbi:MAG TPA: MFS transporter [Nocardioidaceae bacterium]|nr:MFS transporter [Nocardioidaceae bacterium]